MFTLEGTFLDGRKLVVRFKTMDGEARTEIHFERTLRVPDDGKTWPLPSGLGLFPMRYVDDFEKEPPLEWAGESEPIKLPPEWTERGGVIMPVHPSEAMCIAFYDGGYPCAIKIGVGNFNAVNGEAWREELSNSPGDYIVAPPQRWLDGFYIGNNKVRQFVAVPQAPGQGAAGGIRIVVYPMKQDHYDRFAADRRALQLIGPDGGPDGASAQLAPTEDEGRGEYIVGFGGRMKEHIYACPHGYEAWDQGLRASCVVTLIGPEQWRRLTRTSPPGPPPTRDDYDAKELPWHDDYSSDVPTVEGSSDDGPALSAAVDPERVRQVEPPYVRPPSGSRFLRAFTDLRRLLPF
jgi:hypothetical protein